MTKLCALGRLTLTLLMLVASLYTARSQEAATTLEDEIAMGSIDDIIMNSANTSHQFDLIHDENTRTMILELDMMVSFEEYHRMQMDDGYINDTSNARRKRTAGLRSTRSRWTNNIVPYQLKNDFSGRDIQNINAAIADWERYTCLDFQRRSSGNRIYMQNGGGCYSRVGMTGGAQELGLAPGCRVKGVIIHEIGHALGLHHEQTRPDRDDHVTIVRSNIASRMYYNFQKNSWNTILNMGIPYDYTSIMHYGKTAFTVNGGLTIRTRDPAKQDVIGNRHGLSFRDIKSINIMYNCKRHTRSCTKTDSQCPGEGFVDKNCQCICPGGSLRSPTRSCGGTTGGGRVTTQRPRPTVRPTPRPTTRPTGCSDGNRNCAYWARRGECNNNPGYMNVYCKRSCNRCNGGTGGGSTSCRDRMRASTCQFWRSRGYCRGYYSNSVLSNCRRTCGACRGNYGNSDTCTDDDTQCPAWASTGECTRNPAYMLVSCKRSCGQCNPSASSAQAATTTCRDGSGYCATWASQGYCQSNAAYMRINCRLSCRICS